MAQGDHTDYSQPKAEDLGCPPTLGPWVKGLLPGEEVPWAGKEHKNNSNWSATPKPSLEDSYQWVLQHACQVETLAWWPELWQIPNQTDIPQLTRWVWTSFQMPKVRCHNEKMENDYLVPPTPTALIHFCPLTL